MANPVPPVPPTNIPPAPAVPLPLGQAVPAEVAELPPSLSNVKRTIILRGEVQQQNKDGTVRIATPRGPVDVRLPEPQPQPGQRVEVTLPAGSPPREASVRAATPQPQQPQLPPQTNAQAAPTTQPTVTPRTQGQPIPIQTTTTQPPVVTNTTPQTNAQAAPTTTANTNVQNPNQVSPQGLLNFLKTGLQNMLKTPGTNTSTPSSPTTQLGLGEKPLQIGQLLRLIPFARPNAVPLTQAVQTNISTQNTIISNTVAQANTLPIISTGQSTPLLSTPTSALNVTTTAPTTVTTQIATTLQNVLTTPLNPPTATSNAPATAQTPNLPISSTTPRIILPFSAPTANQPLTTNINFLTPTIQPQAQSNLIQTAQNIVTLNPDGTVQKPTQQSINIPVGHQKVTIPNVVDARVSTQAPTTTHGAIPTPQIATLLNGTPTTPVLFAMVTGQLNAQGLPIVEVPLFSNINSMTPNAQKTFLPMVMQFPAKGMMPTSVLRLDIMQTGQMISLSNLQGFGQAEGITWDALDEILRNLPTQGQAQPGQSATQIIQSTIPKPGSVAFSAGVLMFMAAARGGDITAWLGERGMDAVRNTNRADLLSRLGGDFASMARAVSLDDGAPSGEWRALSLPMLFGYDELSRAHMHYRSFEQDSEDGMNERKSGTRFILDLNMSRMGPIQIDGYSINKKLDVTLRTEQNLSPTMREKMRLRYHEAVDGIGFAGQLNFSAKPDKSDWIDFDDTQPALQSTSVSS